MLDGFQPLLGNKSIMAISHDQGGQTALQWMNSLPMEHPAFIDHFPAVNPSKTRISHSLQWEHPRSKWSFVAGKIMKKIMVVQLRERFPEDIQPVINMMRQRCCASQLEQSKSFKTDQNP